MNRYTHITLEERERLFALRLKGMSIRKISKELGRSHTSLSRELKRNAKYGREYIPCRAHLLTEKRMKKQRQKAALKNPGIYVYVREHLRMRWSPETIAGRLHIDHPEYSIDDETIYRYIYASRWKQEKFQKYLVLHRKKRMKKMGRRVRRNGKIPNAISIDRRPNEVNLRIEEGHWETDNVEGKRTDKTVLSTNVERVTRLTFISKLQTRKAEEKTQDLIYRLRVLPTYMRKTLTADNGHENAFHSEITSALDMPVYFCHAYHSWEKGTVENMNQRIRRYIPKGVSIDTIPLSSIETIEKRLNNTPRKCLGFMTPYEKYLQIIKQDAVY